MKRFVLFFALFTYVASATVTCPTSFSSVTFAPGHRLEMRPLSMPTREALLSELMQRNVEVELFYNQHGLGKVSVQGPIRNIVNQGNKVRVNIVSPRFFLDVDAILEVEVKFANGVGSLTLATNGLPTIQVANTALAKQLYPPRAPVFLDDADDVMLAKMGGDEDVENEAVKKARTEARRIVQALLDKGQKAALVRMASMNVMQEQIPEFYYISGSTTESLLLAIQRANAGDLSRLNRMMGAEYPHQAREPKN